MDRPLKIKPSSQVHSGTYDPQTERLTLELNGGSHAYHNFPQDLVDGLEKASSPGTFFHDNIRGRDPKNPPYKTTRIR